MTHSHLLGLLVFAVIVPPHDSSNDLSHEYVVEKRVGTQLKSLLDDVEGVTCWIEESKKENHCRLIVVSEFNAQASVGAFISLLNGELKSRISEKAESRKLLSIPIR